MEDKNQKKYRREYGYFEWSDNFFNELDTIIQDAEASLRKFSDMVDASPQHALEFYAQDLCKATHILLELKNLKLKIEGHPSLPLIAIINDTMKTYLNAYKNADYQATSANLITNALNIYRNMAFSEIYQMLERATKLYSKIKEPVINNNSEETL